MTYSQSRLVAAYREILVKAEKYDNRKLQKLAAQFGITNKTEIKESAELAVVQANRAIALNKSLSHRERFLQILSIYQSQVNMSHRTVESMRLQQYSTPGPIAYLASAFVAAGAPKGYFLEPSAGNGSLTVAMEPHQVHVNEVDELRRSNLEEQGFAKVTKIDASSVAPFPLRSYDGTITNPPFGRSPVRQYGKARIKFLEQQMALEALNAVKDHGRAAIIIGGHTNRNDNGLITAKDKPFYAYLYDHFHVVGNYNIDGSLYSRMGTSFSIRLILLGGRKAEPGGLYPITKDEPVIDNYDELYELVAPYLPEIPAEDETEDEMKDLELEAEALALEFDLLRINEGLGAPYFPTSSTGESLKVETPDSMAFHSHQALARVDREVGGIAEFVKDHLQYHSLKDLQAALYAEQIDSIGLGIYNMQKGTGLVIGDQAGIGKGRQAAAFIRFGCLQGAMPVFITISDGLFTDIHRDLKGIGSGNLRPFIVNGRKASTNIMEGDTVVYKGPTDSEFETYADGIISENEKVIAEFRENYDYIVATYTQFSSEQPTLKQRFLSAVAKDNYLVLDESHSSSGTNSNTGKFFLGVLGKAQGVIYLSATFAKSPKNLPLYAQKTSMRDSTLTDEELVSAITGGGVAMQEIISANLVEEGEMIRRERSYKGIEVNYIPIKHKKEQHRRQADAITDIVRDIIYFQNTFVKNVVKDLDEQVKGGGEIAEVTKGTSNAGVDNHPYFSKVFQIINQMLMAIKADDIADRALERLKEGKKVVITFGSTFESFLDDLTDLDTGEVAGLDSKIRTDFSQVMQRGLDGVLRYTVTDSYGNKGESQSFDLHELGAEAGKFYFMIKQKIKKASTGISLAPIDHITQKLEKAGYKVGEVTGRKKMVQLNENSTGYIRKFSKPTKSKAFQSFQDNKTDVLLINMSGSTGKSAHSEPTKEVPSDKVKQRCMIILQPDLDVNIEVQKRGRIFRTGQKYPPIYDYMISMVPAEMRLMMMLQKKLKSLDANTSSNQKNSSDMMNTADFLNKYGNEIVEEYLKEHPGLNATLGDPLGFLKDVAEEENARYKASETDPALKVSGRVAILSSAEQEKFYNDVLNRYNKHIELLKSKDEYDLEVEVMPLEAETLESRVLIVGKNSKSVFGANSYLEKCKVKVMRKPLTKDQVQAKLQENLAGVAPEDVVFRMIQQLGETTNRLEHEYKERVTQEYSEWIKDLVNMPKFAKIESETDRQKAIMDEVEKNLAERDEKIAKESNKLRQNENNLKAYFKTFVPGTGVLYDLGNDTSVPAVCLGFTLTDPERTNPFTPSYVEFHFAVANGVKYVTIPGSRHAELNGMRGAYMSEKDRRTALENWEILTKESAADYQTRYIITGNLLQAYGSYRGKLISYSRKDAPDGIGILLSETFDIKEVVGEMVTVPILMAYNTINSLMIGRSVQTKDKIVSIIRQSNGFKFMITGSKKVGGRYFMDEELNKIIRGGQFEKNANFMVGMLLDDSFLRLALEHLQRLGASLEIEPRDFAKLQEQVQDYKPKETIDLSNKHKQQDQDDELELLELEAEALALEFEMLNLNL